MSKPAEAAQGKKPDPAGALLGLLGRLMIGKPAFRRPGTATFFSDGERPAHFGSRTRDPKRELAGWKRAGNFWLIVALCCGFAFWRTGMIWVLAITGGISVGLFVVWAAWQVRMWEHHREKEYPAHVKLAPLAGVPLTSKPRQWLDIPLTYGHDPEAEIRIYPPPELDVSDQMKKDIPRILTATLGIEAPDMDWSHLYGSEPYIACRQSEPPPGYVTLSDIKTAIERSGPNEVITGLGRKNTAVPISLDDDSPHIALSIGPGGGKTMSARGLAIQVLRKGGLVIILNAKKTGYNWTRGLPNVAHAKTIDDIADCLIWLNAERMRREDIVEAEGDIEDQLPAHVNLGPRILAIFEEQNLTVSQVKKSRPDAYEALGYLNFAGRAALINMLAIAQRYSAKAAGGGDVRAAVNARILGRYDKDAWVMLAKAFSMPALNGSPGRVQVVTDQVREAQMPYVTGQEAHDFALSGQVALCPSSLPCRCAPGRVLVGHAVENGPDQHLDPGTPPVPRLIGLADAVEEGITSLTLHAIRQRRKRDPKFPAWREKVGPEYLYDERDLIAWEDAR